MAGEAHGKPTYPVWVGSLKETLQEKELQRAFTKFGPISSTCIMRDVHGVSKRFGYVNFVKEADAERAAEQRAGFKLAGIPVKTKGPKTLRQQGHFIAHTPHQMAAQADVHGGTGAQQDFRPVTDCSFFIQGAQCKKGSSCPYRHSDKARSTQNVCPDWLDKRCSNLQCPLRHPGGKEPVKSPVLQQPPGARAFSSPPPPPQQSELQRCGGRCGDAGCAALFLSSEDLAKHIKLDRLPHCRYCRAIFLSEQELLDHSRVCKAKRISDSASFSSESADIEVLSEEVEGSDSDSVLEEGEEEEEELAAIEMARPPTTASSGQKKPRPPGAATPPAAKAATKRKRTRGRRRPGTKTAANITEAVRSSSSGEVGSALNAKQKRRGNSQSVGSNDRNASTSPSKRRESGPTMQPTQEEAEYNFDAYNNYEDEDFSNSDEDDLEETIMPHEMTRLLSLNEQDMYENAEGESDKEEDKDKGGDLFNLGSHFHRGKQPNGEPLAIIEKSSNADQKESSGSDSDKLKRKKRPTMDPPKEETPPPPKTATQRVQVEPVGVFWDIENCPVPLDKCAFSLANKIRREFFEGKREAEFMCVCDITKERKEVTKLLQDAQVTLVHVNAIAKNAADDKLRQHLRRFAHTFPAPSTVVLISGDVNFSPELNDLRHIHNITIVLVHNQQASEALKVFANTLINFDDFLRDVGPPKTGQRSTQPNVVLVSGLPNTTYQRLSNQLNRISDNCGGRVLRVDVQTGTARVLFRTPEWAAKAQKRMNGEDIYGSKIKVVLERHQQHQLSSAAGPALSKSFPPRAPPPFHQAPPPHRFPAGPRTPPPPRWSGAPPPSPWRMPLPLPTPPQQHQFPPRPLFPPPMSHGPLTRPAPPPPFPAPPPPFPPPSSLPPPVPSVKASSSSSSSLLLPEGRILIFKITAVPPEEWQMLNRNVVSCMLEASIKAEHHILWHSLPELQVLLRVDFLQTSLARKDDLVRTLCEKQELRPEIAHAFVDKCTDSLQQVFQRNQLSWDVTTCGWTQDEEEERVTRSQVIGLLRCFSELWTRWTAFKTKYSQNYASAVSEMTIHTACKGVVQILGSPDSDKTQVIVFTDLSPLVKVVNQPQLIAQLQGRVVEFLKLQPDRKIKLLNFVRQFCELYGKFPVSSSGKLLQDVLIATPGVSLVGGKPSKIFVSLQEDGTAAAMTTTKEGGAAKVEGGGGGGGRRKVEHSPPPPVAPPTAQSKLADISAAFINLLINSPNCELPYSKFQQEFQTFYKHSFRVADYLQIPGAKVKDLLEACKGIRLKEVMLSSGKVMTLVCLEPEAKSSSSSSSSKQPPAPANTAATAAAAAAAAASPAALPPESVQLFRQECIEVLSKVPDQKLPFNRFPEMYLKVKGQQFSLVRYHAKKLVQLVQSIPDVVQIIGEQRDRVMVLQPIISQAVCEKRIEELLFSLPDHRISLDRFMLEYEKKFGEKLACLFGHSKLYKLMEDLPNTVEVKGAATSRRVVVLLPLRVFACEMRYLLTLHPNGLPINQVNPVYKETFKKDFDVSRYGFTKLLRTLEAIPDTVDIRGTGPTRKLYLTLQITLPGVQASSSSSSTPSQLPSTAELIDETTAVLMTTYGSKMTALSFTTKYNEAFRSPKLPLVSCAELVAALRPIPNFKLTGAGPGLTIHLVTADEEKEKTKTPEKTKVKTGVPAMHGTPSNLEATIVKSVLGAGNVEKVLKRNGLAEEEVELFTGQPLLIPAEPARKTQQQQQQQQQQPTAVAPPQPKPTKMEVLQTAQQLLKQQPSPPPPPRPPPPPAPAAAVAAAASTSSSDSLGLLSHVSDADSNRVFSETNRLLLCHHEHAMTLSELFERFQAQEEDALVLSVELLHLCLEKHNAKGTSMTAGRGARGPKKLQISYIPSSIGDSVVQLNQSDCLWKLGQDLLYLFVYRPTADFMMTVSELVGTYPICYGRTLVPAIYAFKKIALLLASKQVAKIVKFDAASQQCCLTETARRSAFSALLCELLFLKGGQCRSLTDLPALYQQLFEVALQPECFGVKGLNQLLELAEISSVVELVRPQGPAGEAVPALKTTALLAEQLRFLLTLHDGRIPRTELMHAYTQRFGPQQSIDIAEWFDKKLVHSASHVLNLSAQKWVVWSPIGHPYPPRGSKVVSPAPKVATPPVGVASAAGSSEEEEEDKGSSDFTKQAVPSGAEVEPVTEGILVDISIKNSAFSNSINDGSSEDLLINFDADVFLTNNSNTNNLSDSSSKPSSAAGDVGTASLYAHTPPIQPRTVCHDSSNQPASDVPTAEELLPELIDTFDPFSPATKSKSSSSSCDTSTTIKPTTVDSQQAIDSSPYGFLDPDLIAQLTPPNVSQMSVFSVDLPGGAPAALILPTEAIPPHALERILAGTTSEMKAQAQAQKETEMKEVDGIMIPGEIDLSRNPEEVLEEMRSLKEVSGGILTPEQMEPYLNFFGELSSRELDRLEALEKGEDKKSSPDGTRQSATNSRSSTSSGTSGGGTSGSSVGGTKQKRQMAIRFPGPQQSSSLYSSSSSSMDATYREQEQRSMQYLRDNLPAVPNLIPLSDSDSDSDGDCPVPLSRRDYIRTLLEKGLPKVFSTEEELRGEKPSTLLLEKEGGGGNEKAAAATAAAASFDEKALASELDEMNLSKPESRNVYGNISEAEVPRPLISSDEASRMPGLLFATDPRFAALDDASFQPGETTDSAVD